MGFRKYCCLTSLGLSLLWLLRSLGHALSLCQSLGVRALICQCGSTVFTFVSAYGVFTGSDQKDLKEACLLVNDLLLFPNRIIKSEFGDNITTKIHPSFQRNSQEQSIFIF